MVRVSILVTIVAVALAGWLAGARAPLNVAAQEGTSVPDETGPPPGLTFETLAYGPVAMLPPAPAIAVIDRITIAPGATLPGEPGDPGFSLLYVERGTLSVRADTALDVTRATALTATLATPGATPALEEVAAGTDFTLAAGDSAAFPPVVGVEFRNDGAEPVAVLAASIAPTEAGMEAATPVP